MSKTRFRVQRMLRSGDAGDARRRPWPTSRREDGGEEAGAVLILALMFLVVVGVTVGALATWTANGLSNTGKFEQSRSSQYALSSATQLAIQNIRYTPLLDPNQTLNASPPSYCWGAAPSAGQGTVSELTTQGVLVAVWCSTVWTPTSSNTRVVTITACNTIAVPTPSSGSSLASVQAAAAACAASPGLQTQVTFDDYSASNATPNPGVCLPPPGGSCGAGMTINSSMSGAVPPTVTGLSGTTQGPVTGGTALTVTGTGFVSGSTVNFVATAASSNIAVAGVNPTFVSSTSLTVTTPPATTVTSYYVIVTNPNGSSLAGTQAEFTYQPVVPAVTSIATGTGSTSGSAAGGTGLKITGTGFLSNLAGDNTTVKFVDTANSAVVLSATSWTINPYTLVNGSWVQTITATTPAIATTDNNYYVIVTTTPGGSSASGPIFTFQGLTPVTASVSPTSGGSGTSVTLTGIGFVSGGTTVQLIPVSGTGATLTMTNVSVSASTTLTATIPSGGTSNQAYYVEVTTATGGACPPSGCGANGGGSAPQFTY